MSSIKALGIPKIKALGLGNLTGGDNKEVYEIKSIKIVTALESGSANDGKKINVQKGMLYGKNYTFEVAEYLGKRTTELTSIKWEISYNDFDSGKIVNLPVNARGERVTINMGNLESCGRYLYIRAYIRDKKNTAVLKIWKHNRFRWFDQIVFEKELGDRIGEPWRIDQSGTSLCGMACIFYLFAKENANEYKRFSRELFSKGEATYNNFIVKPAKELLEKKINKEGFPQSTGNMPIVDYITLAGTRNTENPSYKGGDEDFQAINWPDVMLKLCREFLGYAEVEEKGANRFMKRIKYNDNEITDIISDINQQIQNEYKLLLMIDSDLINDVRDFGGLDYHWVVLESQITEIDEYDINNQLTRTVDFQVYSWGTNPFDKNKKFLRTPISRNHCMNNFYGYIKVK
jgi:hypothetical protein